MVTTCEPSFFCVSSPESATTTPEPLVAGDAPPAPSVSTPIRWDEVDTAEPGDLTIATVPKRFAELGDLHAGIDDAVFVLDELLEYSRSGLGVGMSIDRRECDLRDELREETEILRAALPDGGDPASAAASSVRPRAGDRPAGSARQPVRRAAVARWP